MATPKLVQILNTLTELEWKSVKSHIHIYHSRDTDAGRVFQFLHDHRSEIADWDDLEPKIAKVFKSMSAKVFYNYLSSLLKLVQHWLVNDELDTQSKSYFDLLYYKALSKRGLYQYADAVKLAHNREGISVQELIVSWLFNFQEYYSHNPIKYEKKGKAMIELCSSFDQMNAHMMQMIMIELHSWGDIQKIDYSTFINQYSSVLETISSNEDNQYFDDLKNCYLSNDLILYDSLVKRYISKELPAGSIEEVVCMSYLLRIIKRFKLSGLELDYNYYYAKLYDFGMDQGVFMTHGSLTPVAFRNIINNLSSFQSLDQTQVFIDRWINKINSRYIDSTRNVCYALNFLKHGHYEKVLLYTRDQSYHDVEEKSLARILQLVAAFVSREKEYDLFVSLSESFGTYIKRNKDQMSSDNYLGLINSVRILNEIDKKGKNIDPTKFDPIYIGQWVRKHIKE